ncbi:cytochrome P450 4c3-like [Ostrinia nubilalis]|uniref:Cytochrome P450 monooxygenase CYP341A29 n=2 Tax=Ostrinia furnacalis TaxID=93504 RepID=A0A7S9CEF3_OSTFU|nr:cytochrome P450 monooxygenase CYP341A29 [Ostrinia furnacalis]
MFLWVVLITLVLWTVVFRYRRQRMYKLAGKIPGPSTELPVIGIAHTLAGDTEDIMSWLQRYSYAAMEHDGILKAWLNHILYFIVINPVDMEVILKSCLEKDDLHRFIRNVIGYGGIFAPVSIWRRRRKILVPAFSPKIVESFVEVFSEQSQKLTKQLSDYVSTGSFSIWPFVSAYTLDSVCESAMGVKINAQGDPNTPFLLSMSRILNLACERIFHLWLQPDWLYKLFTWKYNEHQKCLNHMHGFTDDVIQKKREELRNEQTNKTEADNAYDLSNYKNKSFLDHLIHLSGGENGYTNVELREEVLTLTIAGTDTSAVAIGFTLALLAKYPEVQEKVYQELYDVFEDSDRPLVKEDLLKLKYLERVVKESLRLFPPVPFIIRKVLEEITLPSGRVLPAGSGVVCAIWGVHRDPKYWGPDADSFDPDRFLPERFNLKHSCSYMPFSQGPRNCLGYQYALMSVKTALSAVLRKYKVVGPKEKTSQPHVRVKLDVMMKAVDGYQVALERRQPVTNKVN